MTFAKEMTRGRKLLVAAIIILSVGYLSRPDRGGVGRCSSVFGLSELNSLNLEHKPFFRWSFSSLPSFGSESRSPISPSLAEFYLRVATQNGSVVVSHSGVCRTDGNQLKILSIADRGTMERIVTGATARARGSFLRSLPMPKPKTKPGEQVGDGDAESAS